MHNPFLNHTEVLKGEKLSIFISSLRRISDILNREHCESNQRLVLIHDALSKIIELDGLMVAVFDSDNEMARHVVGFEMGNASSGIPVELTRKEVHSALHAQELIEIGVTAPEKAVGIGHRLIVPMRTPLRQLGFMQAVRGSSAFSDVEGEILTVVGSMLTLLPELNDDEPARRNSQYSHKENADGNKKLQNIVDLARTIAHELNQPLTGITGYCALIQESFSKGDAIYEDLEEIQRQAARLERLIVKFQNVAHIEYQEQEKHADGSKDHQ